MKKQDDLNPFKRYPDLMELAKTLSPGHTIEIIDPQGERYRIDNTGKVSTLEDWWK